MRPFPLLALAALASALLGVIAWELDDTSVGGKKASAPAASAVPSGATSAPVAPSGRTAEFAATGLARPLFSPSRRPPAQGATASAPPDTTLPRLTGILVSPHGRSAIFAGGPPPVVVVEGGQVGAFTVRSIEPGRVTLLGPDGLRSVRPSFGASPPPPLPGPRRPQPSPGLPLLPPPILGGSSNAPSPALPDAPKDAMPFEQNPSPSGLDIMRNEATRARAPAR